MILPPPEVSQLSLLDVPMAVPFDSRRLARQIYWRGYDCEQISQMLGLKPATVRSWKHREDWDNDPVVLRVQVSLEARFCQLIMKENKTGGDFKEIDLLGRQFERMARVQKFLDGGNEADLNPNVANRNKGERKKPQKNYISEEDKQKLIDAFENGLFEYQKVWARAGDEGHEVRFILKSRQIGATYYFAREALIRALKTGNNQIFLSASEKQALNFRDYIIDFVYEVLGIVLKGNPLELNIAGHDKMVRFYFLGTNFRTAQSYHGDVYFDECFWVFGWKQFQKVGAGMASQKFYRETYFSVPSGVNHEAYEMWSGEAHNKGRDKSEKITIDFKAEGIKQGQLYGDGIWRQIVTIEDAERGGCNLFNIEKLRATKSIEEFANLYMCEFIDDGRSAFPLSIFGGCLVSPFDKWDDFKPFAIGQRYNGPVAIGYDPAHSELGDRASMVIVALPTPLYPKFRTLEKKQFRGMDYTKQAEEILKMRKHYDVAEINIDTTGSGASVHQVVVKKFKDAKAINYNPIVKSGMVYMLQSLLRQHKFEIDEDWKDVIGALISIYPKVTDGGKTTFAAGRSAENGHGDLGWALLHTLYGKDPSGETKQKKGRIRTS